MQESWVVCPIRVVLICTCVVSGMHTEEGSKFLHREDIDLNVGREGTAARYLSRANACVPSLTSHLPLLTIFWSKSFPKESFCFAHTASHHPCRFVCVEHCFLRSEILAIDASTVIRQWVMGATDQRPAVRRGRATGPRISV